MSVVELSVQNYRSIRRLRVPLAHVTVVTGSNGCGKSNLYRSLSLLSAAATGRFSQALAQEGGMPSALWAGPRRKGPVRMSISVRTDEFVYEIGVGLRPPDPPSAFALDPQIQFESAAVDEGGRRRTILERRGGTAWLVDAAGARVEYPFDVPREMSVLGRLREPHRYPFLSRLREELASWRFYHQFRTDAASPIRAPQPALRTPALADDGSDLAAAIATIAEHEARGEELQAAVARAFSESSVFWAARGGRIELTMSRIGLERMLTADELSDGTLRYLCLAAALLSPEPPPLLALNEPETSLHPSLFTPLAGLIAAASSRSQIWVTTHDEKLAEAIGAACAVQPLPLVLENGETALRYFQGGPDDGDGRNADS